MDILSLIGRDSELFKTDINVSENEVRRIVEESSFLVIGGTGFIYSCNRKEMLASFT